MNEKTRRNFMAENTQISLIFEVVEIILVDYKGGQATFRPAYAVGFDGKPLISSHSERPDWSFDRAEVEARVQELSSTEDFGDQE
jgi:hypothetical protein